MKLFKQIIIWIFAETTLCQNYTENVFSINLTKSITAMYGNCIYIPYELTVPLKMRTPYTKVWFNGNKEWRDNTQNTKFEMFDPLPVGEHVFGLRLEWVNETYTYPETVQVSVSALNKLPDVTMEHLIEGQLSVLRCTAPYLCNRDSATIKWKGVNITSFLQNRNIMRFSPVSSTIQFIPKSEDHNSNVTCQQKYRYTQTEKNITLNVHYAPKILSSSKCVLKENKTICRCVSHGNPPPALRWLIGGSTSWLNWLQVNQTNYGNNVEGFLDIMGSHTNNSTIQCVSSNDLGNATKHVNTQNLTGFFPTNEMKINELTVPLTIAGVSLCLNLILLIVVIFQNKEVQKKRCNEERVYASLRRTSVEQDYSQL